MAHIHRTIKEIADTIDIDCIDFDVCTDDEVGLDNEEKVEEFVDNYIKPLNDAGICTTINHQNEVGWPTVVVTGKDITKAQFNVLEDFLMKHYECESKAELFDIYPGFDYVEQVLNA